MATNALVGIDTIEYGTVQGDGSMPTSMTAAFGQLVPDSVVLTFDEPAKTDIYVEGQDAPYITIPDPNRVRSLAFRVRDMQPDTLTLFFGGSVATNKWSAPVSETAIFYAIKAKSKVYDTTYYTVDIPKALILASMDGKMYKTETSEVSIKADVQAVDNAGTPVSPIQISKTN
jgi:hypothetical protein